MRYLVFIALLGAFGCDAVETPVAGPCLTSAECVEGSLCFDNPGDVALCMETCDADTRLCEEGEVCIPVASDAEAFVCYLGGSVEPEGSCTDGGECVAGSVCIDSGSGGVCRRACDTRGPACSTPSDTCVELTAPAGFCMPGQAM